MGKVKVGIIGTGNIGTDLLYKIQRSDKLECSIFAGRNIDSKGIQIAKKMDVPTTINSINFIEENPNCCDIVFDATSASVHRRNHDILKKLGIYSIDLTPSNIGKMCIPAINLNECLEVSDVNLITCGGQATVPLAYAVKKVSPVVNYFEIVATIASKSAGPGTRNNIDEFTQTTRESLSSFTGVKKSKAIIILNPAEPPITMHNTLYSLIDEPNLDEIAKSVKVMEREIKKYVPGYKVIMAPLLESNRVTTTIQVEGLGDYLPKYSGNLDIITCAGLKIAEEYAINKIGGI